MTRHSHTGIPLYQEFEYFLSGEDDISKELFHDLFYFSGFLDDTEIRLDKMKLLMTKYENIFDDISKKYLVKMNQSNT